MCKRNKLSIISPTSECLLAIFFLQCIIITQQLFIRYGFCDIQNNQSLNKSYQPMPKAEADNSYIYLDYSGLKKKLLLIILHEIL